MMDVEQTIQRAIKEATAEYEINKIRVKRDTEVVEQMGNVGRAYLFRYGYLTSHRRLYSNATQAVKEIEAKAKREKLHPNDIQKLQIKKASELQKQYKSDVASDKLGILEEMNKLRSEYKLLNKEGNTEELIKMRKVEARIAAMSDEEIEEEASKYMNAQGDDRNRYPYELELIASRLKVINNVTHTTFKAMMKKYRYNLPHLHSDKGRKLSKQLDMLDSPEEGNFKLEVDGKPAVFSISSLLEMAPKIENALRYRG